MSNDYIFNIKNCVLAVRINLNNNTETYIIGDNSDVSEFITSDKTNACNIYQSTCEELGSLTGHFLDIAHFELAAPFNDYNLFFKNSESDFKNGNSCNYFNNIEYIELKKKTAYLINNDNVFHKYIYIKLFTELNKRLHLFYKYSSKVSYQVLTELISDINTNNFIWNYKDCFNSLYKVFLSDYYKRLNNCFQTGKLSSLNYRSDRISSIRVLESKNTINIIFDHDLVSAFNYYISVFFNNGYAFKKCKRCGAILLLKKESKREFCKDCIKEKQKENREKYSLNNDNYEFKCYEATRIYWYRKRKIVIINKGNVKKFDNQFNEFKKQSQLKKQTYNQDEYKEWLLQQRNKCDQISNFCLKGDI